jgi:hypothetical protein
LVQEQTLQVLINRRDQNKNLANVKFRARSRQVAEEDAQKTMDQTKALGLISGTVIPSTTSTLVWFKWAWTGNTQVARLQAPLFPNIDDFLAQYMQQLEKTVTPSGTGTFAVENATAEALTRENQRLRAELINLRAGSGDPTPQALNIKRYAIAIGNSAYEHIPNLRYAIDDALAFANAIQRGPEGVAHSNVTILFNASRQSTLSAIDNLTHQATPGSYIYFYYSGHSLSQGGKSFIVPVDSNDEARTHNAIAIAEILQMLSTAPSAASIFFFSTVTSTSLSCAIDDILGLV